MNIGILGWWHYDNQGDLQILEGMTRVLWPHRTVPIDLPFPLNEGALQRLNLLDFLIVGGGGLFQETPPPPLDTFHLWKEHLTAPLGVAGVGVDGIPPEHRASMDALIEQARFFFVRDPISQQVVGHPKAQVAPDFSFLQPLDYGAAAQVTAAGTASACPMRKHRVLGRTPPVCGINLRQAPGLDIDRWIETLQGLSLRLRGIPLSTYAAFREVQILQQVDPACTGAFDAGLYRDLDLMIGMAFHSVLFAIQAGVPVLAIAYAPKVRRFMADVGLQDYVLEVDEWHKLPERIEQLRGEYGRLVDRLHEITSALCQAACQAMADVRTTIEGADSPHPQSHPRASVVIVGTAWDTANRDTILSCLEQTYRQIEVILVTDDAQPDTRLSPSVPEFQTVTVDPDLSLGERLNRGFAQATGEYLSWTMGGSAYARDAIACMASRLQREPGCDMVFADYYTMHKPDLIADAQPVDSAHKLLRRDVIGPCFLYRRELATTVGSFRTDTPLVAYDYWLRAHGAYDLQPTHARLFYALRTNAPIPQRQMEREVRRRWRSTRPWLLKAVWWIAETDLVQNLVINPLLAGRRKVREFLRRSRHL